MTLLIGGLCGLAAVSFHLLLDFFQSHFIHAAAAAPHWWPIPALIIIPVAGGLITGAGLYFLAPEARGSGIPQVKSSFYLNGGRIPARVIPGKMFLAAINIGAGASLGREGPTVQICAAIILPLMIANITSYVVAIELSPKPIYDALLTQDGIRLPQEERQVLRQIPVVERVERAFNYSFEVYLRGAGEPFTMSRRYAA